MKLLRILVAALAWSAFILTVALREPVACIFTLFVALWATLGALEK